MVVAAAKRKSKAKSAVEDGEEAPKGVLGEVTIVELSTVKPNTWNPNRMTDFQFRSLSEDMRASGWPASEALLVWGSDHRGKKKNVIINGEHRHRAATAIGMTHGPVAFLHGATEKQAKEWTIKLDNKRGSFDPARLGELVREIAEGSDLNRLGISLGFDSSTLDGLLKIPTAPTDETITVDDENWEEAIGDSELVAPFPYFGGKRSIAGNVWARLGSPKQYIEPFCGSAAMLLASPQPASLEVINDTNGFIANFWRAVKYQPAEVAKWADYPVSHVDLGARHKWLVEQQNVLEQLQDPNWEGDAKIAGWWLWGQCSWIGSGWCESSGDGIQVPHIGNAGMGVQARGKIPHTGSAGIGVNAVGKIPEIGTPGRGVQAVGKSRGAQAIGQVPRAEPGVGILSGGRASKSDPAKNPEMHTSAGRVALVWLAKLAARLERCRVFHCDWSRALNNHYGTDGGTAIFFDPPYRKFEKLYAKGSQKAFVADEVAAWCKAHPEIRIALAGHVGDYDLPGWSILRWTRKRLTYGGAATTDLECIWFSPACLPKKAA